MNGLWNIRACTGNKFLKEINPMNMKGLIKENVIAQIKSIIHKYYEFFGYTEETATELTVSIHEHGSAIVAVLPYEIAEQKGVEVTESARKQQYPLQIKLEPDEK